jgi:NAD(P)H-dependent flavin oxidoreductase YrpB (nitropropane dioxygenase family)
VSVIAHTSPSDLPQEERPIIESARTLPLIIQGGMGVGISGWELARAVSRAGQLGVVSGTGLDILLARRLEDGDPGGHVRRALEAFPIPGVAARVLTQYFRRRGRPAGTPYRTVPMLRQRMSVKREQLIMIATFVEVYLAREGHDGAVGINLLTKIQLPTLASLYGAMLAGVGFVMMGAGIPIEIPGVLDRLADHEPATLRLEVAGVCARAGEVEELRFDPRRHGVPTTRPLTRPRFFAVVASNSLATLLARKATGRVDGFVIEGPTAGGHNAPPRGEARRNERGEPIYGKRDMVDLAAIRELGLPFWCAGGMGSPEALTAAIEAGAAGIQVGTLFAFCNESGLSAETRRELLASARAGLLDVFTDPLASPTGYPFKIVVRSNAPIETVPRTRVCDIGHLRTLYRESDGSVGYRCPSEPVEAYIAKGGAVSDTIGRQCLCNALFANIGYGQLRPDGTTEAPLITAGDQVKKLGQFLAGRESYTANDVLDYLLAGAPRPPEIQRTYEGTGIE